MRTKTPSENWKKFMKLQRQIGEACSSSPSDVDPVLDEIKDKIKNGAVKKKKVPTQMRNKWKKRREQIAELAKSVSKISATDLDALKSSKKIVIGIDCEYVGGGPDGKIDILARVSLVDEEGNCVYDKYTLPTQKITDYRTEVSGIRSSDLVAGNGKTFSFDQVQAEVREILADNILVGHGVHNDLRVLQLSHPKSKTRDTAKFRPIHKKCNTRGKTPSLRIAAQCLLGLQIHTSEHSSVEDARVAMALYRMFKGAWESQMKKKH